jgi:hypothetical protein
LILQFFMLLISRLERFVSNCWFSTKDITKNEAGPAGLWGEALTDGDNSHVVSTRRINTRGDAHLKDNEGKKPIYVRLSVSTTLSAIRKLVLSIFTAEFQQVSLQIRDTRGMRHAVCLGGKSNACRILHQKLGDYANRIRSEHLVICCIRRKSKIRNEVKRTPSSRSTGDSDKLSFCCQIIRTDFF